MNSSPSSHTKANALEVIKSYRVSELQALLDYAKMTRQGNKRDLLLRCKILIGTNFTPQLANKITQINNTRLRTTKPQPVSSTRHHPVVLPKTPPMEILPSANHIQFMNLPFYDKMRTIDCVNMPVDWHTFSPIRFLLNETDIDLIRKNSAKLFLRIAPTILHERHNDVLPPYLFVQCNNQPVISNNVSKTVGSQAHTVSFPTDITDKIILKANASNTLTFIWLQSPMNMSLKNLPKSYTLTIQLVHCVSIDTLFDLIIKREPFLPKTDNDDDSDIEIEDLGLMATRHRVSLLCPITQSLIVVPTKSTNCSHLTCFDLRAFLQMNERRLQWTCPLCKKSALFESLRIDERLKSILSNVPSNCSTVEIDSSSKLSTDCQYILDCVKQEKLDVTDTTNSYRNNEDQATHHISTKSRRQSDESDCIVLSSGSESEDEDEDEEVNTDDVNNSSLITIPLYLQNGDNDERQIKTNNDHINPSPNTSHLSSSSPIMSTVDDGTYWEDLAQITYDLSSDDNDKFYQRKRSNSSTSSIISSSSKSNDRRKRKKRSSSTKSQLADTIDVITLSSSDNSDIDDQLS